MKKKIPKKREINSKHKKQQDEIFQPHDAFFKANMGNAEVIADFLHSYLPEAIHLLIDDSSLSPVDPQSISPKLKLREADLLYRLQIAGQSGYLLLLMEHKSYPDRYTPVQILRYITEIWAKELSDDQKICPVLPVVLYQGARKWEYPQLVQSLSEDTAKELLPYLPLYQALYYDFSPENRAALRGNSLKLVLYLRMIRAIYEPDNHKFTQEIIEIFKGIGQFEEDIFFEYMERNIAYISAVRQDMTDKSIMDIIAQGGNTMETIVDRLEKRGEKRGITIGEKRGENKEKLAIAFKLKQDGIPVEKIIEYTGLSREKVEKL